MLTLYCQAGQRQENYGAGLREFYISGIPEEDCSHSKACWRQCLSEQTHQDPHVSLEERKFAPAGATREYYVTLSVYISDRLRFLIHLWHEDHWSFSRMSRTLIRHYMMQSKLSLCLNRVLHVVLQVIFISVSLSPLSMTRLRYVLKLAAEQTLPVHKLKPSTSLWTIHWSIRNDHASMQHSPNLVKLCFDQGRTFMSCSKDSSLYLLDACFYFATTVT